MCGQVLADGEWWKAIITKSENGKYLVHYDGGTAEVRGTETYLCACVHGHA
jgi:hypothetical protein